jgi:tripartite-type tricarboxylate transporter receptor subunit TctC
MNTTRRALLGAAGATLAAPALAQSGPVRIVAPFPPGGSTDALARLLQPGLSRILGVPVIVENRAGASGSLGTAQVARAAPDGNAWVLVFDTHAVNPALIPNMGFDTERDLAPVLLFGTAPMVLTVARGRPFQDAAGVLAAARARPEALTYGTIGNGSLAHLTMELAQQAAGVRLVHVPYRGGGPLATAAMSGEVDLPIATTAALNAPLQAGAIRPVAQSGGTRSPKLRDVPTFQEVGIAGIDSRAFWGFLGPAATPAPIIARMEAALREAIAEPAVRERMEGLGVDVEPQGPEGFRAFLSAQIATWGRVVRERNITPD